MGKSLPVFLAFLTTTMLGITVKAQTPMDGVYIINSALNTGGRNFKTFEDAVTALAINGVTKPVIFDVAANSGPYNEQVIINPITGTSTVNTVTFKCNGARLLFNSTNINSQAGVKLDGAHHIIFDSLVVEPQVTSYEPDMDLNGDGVQLSEYGTGFHLLNNADSNIIRKCTVLNTFGKGSDLMNTQNIFGISISGSDDPDGIGQSHCDYNIITQNTIIGGYYGVNISDYDQNYPVTSWNNDNQVTNNIIKDFHNVGVNLMSCNKALVQGNDISSVELRSWVWAIALNEGNQNMSIIGNRIHNLRAYPGYPNSLNVTGIAFFRLKSAAGKETLVANNLIYDIDYDGDFTAIDIQGDATENFGTSSYINIYHNTIAIGKGPTGTLEGILIANVNPANLKIVNNIFSYIGTTSATRRCLNIPKDLKGYTIDRNDYYTDIAGSTLVRYSGTNYTNIETWKPIAGYDGHSVSADPLYTDPATGNYKPKQGALDNRGSYVGVDKDILNITRGTTNTDVGAYEMVAAPCVTPVVAGASSILPTIVCQNSLVALDLTGNSNGDGQTYQWMSSTTENGTYTNVNNALKSPPLDINATATLYYKAMVTCGTDSKYSTPFQLIVNSSLPAGVYTINSKLPYGNRNFRSFAEALQALSCGISGPVEFSVAPGTGPYNEQVNVPAIKGTSAVNTVTFNGNGEKVSFSATLNTNRGTVTLNNTKHIIVKNLLIDAIATGNAIGVQIYNASDSNIIRNCTISVPLRNSQSIAGVSISGSPTVNSLTSTSAIVNSNYNLIDSCTISGGYWCIVMHTSASTRMTGNSFTNNKVRDFVSEGIHVQGGTSMRISGNDISRTITTAWDNTFMGMNIVSVNPLTISNNKVHNLADAHPTVTAAMTGIRFDACDATSAVPNIVSNNVVYALNGRGVQSGLVNSNSDYTHFYHNTVLLDEPNLVTRATTGMTVTSATGVQIRDNNIVLTRNTATKSYAVNIPATGVVLNNNNYYLDAANTTLLTGKIGTPEYGLLAAWKSNTSQDAASVAIDPKFTNIATGNLKPTEATLKNRGAGVGIVRDILGLRRNTTTPDVGAYEFACVNPVDPALVTNPVKICADATATFNIKDPVADVNYHWYNVSFFPDFTEGTLLRTGTDFTTPAVPATIRYYVEAVATNGCGSGVRVPVTVEVLEKLKDVPVVRTDVVTGETARFVWDPVPGATSYEVSRNRVDFTAPSSGSTGTFHLVTGLTGGDTLSLVVKAKALLECQSLLSDSAFARTLTYTFFVPNMFTPNGDGKNDLFRVYGNTIQSLKLMIFNQWGEKVFEGNDKLQGWNGTFRGQPQPVGVYIYVATLNFTNGSSQTTKGTLSLIR